MAIDYHLGCALVNNHCVFWCHFAYILLLFTVFYVHICIFFTFVFHVTFRIFHSLLFTNCTYSFIINIIFIVYIVRVCLNQPEITLSFILFHVVSRKFIKGATV